MRICHVMFLEGFGGAQRHVAELCNHQLAGGHKVHLITGWKDESGLLSEGVRVHHISKFLASLRLRRLFKQIKPDIIHTHLGWAARKTQDIRPGCPIVTTLHWRYKEKCYGRHDALIALTPAQKDRLPKEIKRKTSVISNWVEPYSAKPADDDLGLTPGKFTLSSAGRLDEQKGFDILIEAYKRAGLEDAQLVIIGEGAQREQLESLREGRSDILLPGYRANVRDYLPGFDLFVMSSRSEPFGLILPEAMQAGCPVISSRCEGPLFILGEDYEAFYESEDIETLTALIRAAYENWRTAGKKRQAKNWDLTRFAPQNQMDEILTLYETLLTAGKAKAARI